MGLLRELKRRNMLLYWFGWYNLIVGIICLCLIPLDHTQVLGINRWIKPAKFFLSVFIMIWTMGWILYYLDAKKKVATITWLFIITMFVENTIITLQSIRGVQSHFNTTSALNGILFGIMGLFIMLFTCVVIYVIILFFRQQLFMISVPYLWGIRMGLILFTFFSLEGGLMVSYLAHTVGGKDGGPGLPLINWSSVHGDLRIAHFMGIHSLQLLPFIGYYITKTKRQIIVLSVIYFIFVVLLLIEALKGMPLVRYN